MIGFDDQHTCKLFVWLCQRSEADSVVRQLRSPTMAPAGVDAAISAISNPDVVDSPGALDSR